MQTKRLEKLDGPEANSLLARRLRNFGRGGLAPELVLRFAARPEIDRAAESPEPAREAAPAA